MLASDSYYPCVQTSPYRAPDVQVVLAEVKKVSINRHFVLAEVKKVSINRHLKPTMLLKVNDSRTENETT
jgi:hypothetical protein